MRKYSVQRYAYGMWCERQGEAVEWRTRRRKRGRWETQLRSERPASSTMYERVQRSERKWK